MRFIQVIPFVLLAACAADSSTDTHASGSAPTRRNAELAFGAISDRLETAASSYHAGVAPVGGAFDVHAACSLAGNVALAGTYDATDTKQTFDADATFTSCQESAGTVDGGIHWHQVVDGDTVDEKLNGALDFTIDSSSFTCSFDLSWTVDPSGVHYAGTMCGYSVDELGLNN